MSQPTLLPGNAQRSGRAQLPLVSRFFCWIAECLPTAIVFAMLVAVAYFGHRHGWRIPRSSVIGTSPTIAEAWCLEHGVPESQCVECRPTLHPKVTDHGWCKEHGVSQCPFCHPDVAQLAAPATALDADVERSKRAFALRPRAENNPRCILYRRRIQFVSLEAVNKVGVDVEPIDRAAIDEVVTANGQITYDRTRVAHLPSKAGGSAWRVLAKIGDRVTTGDVLALVDAADDRRAKAEFLESIAKWEFATATKQRLQPLSGNGTVAGSRMLEAETAIREAWSRALRAQQAMINLGLPMSIEQFQGRSADQIAADLQFLGLPPSLIPDLDRKTTTSNLLPLRASFDGLIVAADVVAGEVVDTSRPLFILADTRRMWLTLDIPSEETDFVSIGQRVRFRGVASQQPVEGQIQWISTEADPQTRTVKVRAILENPQGKLRDETFGTGEIVLRRETEAIVVPKESLQWDGSCHIVFVRDKDFFVEGSPKLFYPRPVKVGVRTDRMIEILAGVLPGEIVVTKGSGVLRGELLKNNLGAG